MTSFRTELSLPPSPRKIALKDRIMTIGSCFSDTMGSVLQENKFTVATNPAGVIYNPLSIHKALSYMISGSAPADPTYVYNNDLYANFDFHSAYSAASKDSVRDNLMKMITQAHAFLQTSDVVMITYGTAWVYEQVTSGEVVANCHKVHGSNFRKRLLTAEEIILSFDNLYAALKLFQPSIKVIVTESPVRHLKDTFELNAVSKSALRLALYGITEKHPIDYFPAYELLLDDLRDYRFYSDDMIHPSKEALDYIWQKFSSCYFDSETINFLRTWQSISAALRHTPFHPMSDSHQRFVRETLARLQELKSTVCVEEEIKILSAQLRP